MDKSTIKDILWGSIDVTGGVPRSEYGAGTGKEDKKKSAASEQDYSVADARILSGLEEIETRYHDAVKQKATAYADRLFQGEFDSDEELYDKAEESLKKIYGGKAETLAAERDAKVSDLELSKEGYGDDLGKTKSKIRQTYQAAWRDNLDDLSRKGLSHSSVADLTEKEITSGYRAAMGEADAAYRQKVAAIDKKIEKAQTAYESALKNYEISYAIKLEDKLNRLKEERDRAVEKYNEEHKSEKEKAYDRYLLNRSTQDQLYEKEYGDYLSEKKANYQERYDYLLGELKGKSKSAVTAFIKRNESALRNALGLYYDRFVEEVS